MAKDPASAKPKAQRPAPKPGKLSRNKDSRAKDKPSKEARDTLAERAARMI